MESGSQAVWIFRIVDQDTGSAVPGVPVTVLDDAGGSAGYWVSDGAGVVTIPRHDRPRLRLRVGLRSEEPIELDTHALHAGPIPLVAPRRGQPVIAATAGGGGGGLSLAEPAAQPESTPHVLRFQRVGVFPQAGEPAATGSSEDALQGAAAFPAPLRSGLLVEVEQYWQSLGCHSGDLLYSMSLAPGDEARAVVLDGRWRREPDAPQRPLQILARMVGTSTLGDGGDAVPLEAFVVTDLQAALIDTVKLLSQRTVRMSEALRRRPLGVTELAGDIPPTAAIRTIRNTRVEGVVTYHFFEPLERFRVIVRTPRVHPVLLVPFRLPNIATFEVVREFSHVIRRALLDRALLPDLERLLAADRAAPGEARIFAHIAANLSYYSAAIITAGDPAGRRAALAKLRDSAGRVLTEVIENTVVGRAGNYVAFPLRSAEFASPEYRAIVGAYEARAQRFSDEIVVTVPIPGVWLRSELAAPMQEPARASAAAEGEEEGRDRSGRVGRRPGRRG